jgi:hypothetical protein
MVILDNADLEITALQLTQPAGSNGILARVPTPEEYDFLIALRNERGYGKGSVVR